ncbi:MAG TPA: helix-turn-helix domain-containing protein [Roseomonas sp.]|jgi:HTH-type transcriptional regulator/antitoxin HipB
MEQIARTPKQIGDALRRRRRALGLNQTRLGEKTSLRQATISDVEGGAPGAQLSTICDMLAALDLECVIRPRTKAAPADIETLF